MITRKTKRSLFTDDSFHFATKLSPNSCRFSTIEVLCLEARSSTHRLGYFNCDEFSNYAFIEIKIKCDVKRVGAGATK